MDKLSVCVIKKYIFFVKKDYIKKHFFKKIYVEAFLIYS